MPAWASYSQACPAGDISTASRAATRRSPPSLCMTEALGAGDAPAHAFDSSAVPTRGIKRGGAGQLRGGTDISWSPRATGSGGCAAWRRSPRPGEVTGRRGGPARANDRALAEALLVASRRPAVAQRRPVRRQRLRYRRQLRRSRVRGALSGWALAERRWPAGGRQVVETAFARPQETFRLAAERPHALCGILARLAAKAGLHNACARLNRAHGRPGLAFANLLGWEERHAIHTKR
jgi:hypothetical protein